MKKFLVLLWAMTLVFGVVGVANALTMATGYNSDAVNIAAVRYRSFGNTGGGEIYLGVPDLGVPGNRAERNMTWVTGSNDVTFMFDEANDKLTTEVQNSMGIFTLEYFNLSSNVVDSSLLNQINSINLAVVGRDNNTTVDFNDVYLDGQPLGDFSGTGGWFNWHNVDYYDFSQGFTLTGTIELSGIFGNSQELSKIEIKIGYDEELNPPIPEPGTMLLLSLGLIGLFALRRKKLLKK